MNEEQRRLAEFYPDPAVRQELHYLFAHQFLPAYVAQNPRAFFLYLTGTEHQGKHLPAMDPTRFIQSRWCMMEERAGLLPEPANAQELLNRPFRRVMDLEAALETIAGKSAAIIQMPTPEDPPENTLARPLAWFVAVVQMQSDSARCFTLERTLATAGSDARFAAYGLLCEWIAQEHRNHGIPVEPDRRKFTAALGEVLKQGT